MAAEAASFFAGRPVLAMGDVTELILVGAFRGINEIYKMSKDVEETGLILYLRTAVKALKLVEMQEVHDPLSQQQMSEGTFGRPKSPVYRYPSLFSPGLIWV